MNMDDFPVETPISSGFQIATFDYQRVQYCSTKMQDRWETTMTMETLNMIEQEHGKLFPEK